jgi:hypothetical protein
MEPLPKILLLSALYRDGDEMRRINDNIFNFTFGGQGVPSLEAREEVYVHWPTPQVIAALSNHNGVGLLARVQKQ